MNALQLPEMHDYLGLCLFSSPATVGLGQGKLAFKIVHLQAWGFSLLQEIESLKCIVKSLFWLQCY